MAEITKHLGIAISDADAGRITKEHLFKIFQEAINNGDLLIEENEFYVIAFVIPLVDKGLLKRSKYLTEFEERMNKKVSVRLKRMKDDKS